MSTVLLIPALDLRDGKCVRLYQGRFEEQTNYDVDPIERAAWYAHLGASLLHIVDLDGAKAGHPVNLELIRRMRTNSGMQIQLGGGIRSQSDLELALEVADRIVLGSLAVNEPDRVKSWMRQYGGDKFTLGFDVRINAEGQPMLSTHGWTRTSATSLFSAIESFRPAGLKHVLCTDIDRDGAMQGPNFSLYTELMRRWPDLQLQASGGVRHAADLTALGEAGIPAAISGKALLDGRLSEQEIRKFLQSA